MQWFIATYTSNPTYQEYTPILPIQWFFCGVGNDIGFVPGSGGTFLQIDSLNGKVCVRPLDGSSGGANQIPGSNGVMYRCLFLHI